MMKEERDRLLYISIRIFQSQNFSDDYNLFTESKTNLMTADMCCSIGRLRRNPTHYSIYNNDPWAWRNLS